MSETKDSKKDVRDLTPDKDAKGGGHGHHKHQSAGHGQHRSPPQPGDIHGGQQ